MNKSYHKMYSGKQHLEFYFRTYSLYLILAEGAMDVPA